MKIKLVRTETLPRRAVDSLQAIEFLREVAKEVLGECLRVEGATTRPAEHYIQRDDTSFELEPGCWGVAVDLTRSSVRDGRYYKGAVERMHNLYKWRLEQALMVGQRVQLMCSISTDKPVPEQSSTLIESQAEWIEGKADLI